MDDVTNIRNNLEIPGYRIIEEIGRGGMAVVYKALQISLGRFVALKVLSPQLAADPDLVKRFQREGKAAASLKHPNIVTIYDVGKAGGSYFIAMEYVQGESLKERLQRGDVLPLEDVTRILKDVASALDYAHKQGFVHRDVKPSNVLIEKETGRALLTDFGVVKALSEGTRLTRTGTFIGTVQYSSPEQIQGKGIGFESDLYSFGVMAYEMVGGKLPFDGDITAVMYAHLHDSPPPLSRQNSGISKRIDRIFGKMLAKSPKKRYRSAAGFVDALRKNITSLGTPAGKPKNSLEGDKGLEKLKALLHDLSNTPVQDSPGQQDKASSSAEGPRLPAEPKIIQQQRQIIHDFGQAAAERAAAEAKAAKELERERKRAKTWLAEQEKARQQQETKAGKQYNADRKAADAALTQAQKEAKALVEQANAALQRAKDAVGEANLPKAISFYAAAPPPGSAGDPATALQRSAEQAKKAAGALMGAVTAWKVEVEAQRQKKQRRLTYLFLLFLVAISVSVIVSSV